MHSTDASESINHLRQQTKALSGGKLLISGALAGCLAKTVVAPMDRVKILFQTNPSLQFSSKNVYQLVMQIYSKTGILSFWKGHTATIVRVVPYSATNFFTFERAYQKLDPLLCPYLPSPATRFICGAISGSVAVCVTYPLETLRARLAVDVDSSNRSYLSAIKTITKTDGARSLYAGLKPTLVGIVPYAGTSFAVYETFKTDEMPQFTRFLVGAIAGISAQAITYPLDVVRRRMQVAPSSNVSMLNTFALIVQREGWIRGLYKGLSMNLIKGPIAIAVSLNANDRLKSFLLSLDSVDR